MCLTIRQSPVFIAYPIVRRQEVVAPGRAIGVVVFRARLSIQVPIIH